jgi:DNA-binding IclR family transcriptional regulator
VWALELLLILKRERRTCSREELVATMRASQLVVTKALDALVAAGLASVDHQGAEYMPANDQVAVCVDELEALYATRPDAVRRAIVSSSLTGFNAFADAFRLRDD